MISDRAITPLFYTSLLPHTLSRFLHYLSQCGAAILLKGSREESLRFVFNVYNQHERNGRLRAEDLTTALLYLCMHRNFTTQHCQKLVAQLFQVADARRQDYVRVAMCSRC